MSINNKEDFSNIVISNYIIFSNYDEVITENTTTYFNLKNKELNGGNLKDYDYSVEQIFNIEYIKHEGFITIRDILNLLNKIAIKKNKHYYISFFETEKETNFLIKYENIY